VLSLGAIAAVLGARATMRDYFVALLVTALMTLYGVVIFNVGLVRPTVTTVRELLSAIDRVRRGEFGERVPVAGIDEFGEVAVAFNDMQRAMHERESLQAAFGSYVDPTLASRLLAQDNSVFEGEDVEVTAFFADVRGFTSFADSATAPEAVQLLNRLFEVLVPVIHDLGGHANHYLGDGLLAVFGAPSPLVNHADMAVAAAIEIQRQVSKEFGGELHIGIGINTGQVIAGTIGGGGRLEFTVIGDAVNVASRLERLTKETGDAILLTDTTMEALTSCSCRTVNRGELDVRGKAKRVRVHAIHSDDLLPTS
jgi:class 3 adenylate cyclase